MLIKKSKLGWGLYEWPLRVLACAEDVLIVAPDSCWIARVSSAGSVIWTSDYKPYAKTPSQTPDHICAVDYVSADCSAVVVKNYRVPTPTTPAKNSYVGLNGNTGSVTWAAESPAFLGANGNGIPLIGGGMLARLDTEEAFAAMFGIRWQDVNSGRFVGSRDALAMPFGTWVKSAAVVENTHLVVYSSVSSALDPEYLGLADTWGNTTCATSGSCWQKSYQDCTDSNPCTSDLCDAAHGGCHHVALPDGITCSDGGGHCATGACK